MKAIINSLALALAEDADYGHVGLSTAKAFAETWVSENADLFAAPPVAKAAYGAAVLGHQPPTPTGAPETFQVRPESGEVAAKFLQRVVGPDGLTDSQRAGVARGIPLCPNCQQPTSDHLPGCARIPELGTDPRAVTKAPLPPSS